MSALQEKPGKESRIRITLNGGVMGIAVTGDLTLDQLNLAADILKAKLIERLNQSKSTEVPFTPRSF